MFMFNLKIIALSLLLAGCTWDNRQEDLKTMGVEYVPMYFTLEEEGLFDNQINLERIKKFSKYLTVNGEMCYGYVLVDSMHVVYIWADEAYLGQMNDSLLIWGK